MANTITSKNIGTSPNSCMLTVHVDTAATIDSDLLSVTTYADETKTLYVTRIDTVMNMGPNDITVDGKVYETGRWELGQYGGIQINGGGAGKVTIAGTSPNAILVLRGELK